MDLPSCSAGALPSNIFNDEHRLHHNDTSIALKYYGPAHTDSDVSVVCEEADIIHVGDTWWNGIYPFIDYSTGGSIDGMIRATERNLQVITDKMIVIPGHGPVGNKSGLTEFRDMLVQIFGLVCLGEGFDAGWMVFTSHNQLRQTGRKTGFWLEEGAAPYFVFERRWRRLDPRLTQRWAATNRPQERSARKADPSHGPVIRRMRRR